MSALNYQQLREMSGYDGENNTPAQVVAWLKQHEVEYFEGKSGRPSSLTEFFLIAKGYHPRLEHLKPEPEKNLIEVD